MQCIVLDPESLGLAHFSHKKVLLSTEHNFSGYSIFFSSSCMFISNGGAIFQKKREDYSWQEDRKRDSRSFRETAWLRVAARKLLQRCDDGKNEGTRA
jgi:hypothetical protein